MLRFTQVASSVDTSFWRTLADKKLHEWKLDAAPKRIVGWMGSGRTGPVLEVNGSSFADGGGDRHLQLGRVDGVLLLCNTVEQFKACDKEAFLASCRESAFCLLVFADLKQHTFLYWFGFPCVVAATPDAAGVSASAVAAATTTVTDVFVPTVPVEIESHDAAVSARFLVSHHAFVADESSAAASVSDGGAAGSASASVPAAASAGAVFSSASGVAPLPRPPSPLAAVAVLFDGGYERLAAVRRPGRPRKDTPAYIHAVPDVLKPLTDFDAQLSALEHASAPADEADAASYEHWREQLASPMFVVFEPLTSAAAIPRVEASTSASASASDAAAEASTGRSSSGGGGTEGAAVLSWFTRATISQLCLRYGRRLASLQPPTAAGRSARLSFLVVRGTTAMLKQLQEGRRLGLPDTDVFDAVRNAFYYYDGKGTPLAMLISGSFAPTASWDQTVELASTASPPPALSAAGATSGAAPLPAPFTVIGWEPNARGQLAPRMANLRTAMDPAALAESSAALNLSLMRWRQLPELDLARIASQRVLLLGCGTLGCAVARDLLAWGVRTMTLVDSGRVQFSNPVRQPLFELEDCTAEPGGRLKAHAAAKALERIHPRVKVTPHTLTIPMPGHPLPATAVDSALADAHALSALIAGHDVVFLLTDTRESRWLPTLLAAHHRKLALTVALGFDTFLVLRHGVPMEPVAAGAAAAAPAAASGGAATVAAGAASSGVDASAAPTTTTAAAVAAAATVAPRTATADASRLGCYFCTDVVAPGDSTSNRTLDQQCTVTRPGGAPISSAFAVELLVSLLHHPQRFHAPADGPTPLLTPGASPLGLVPHQLRGYLTHFFPLLTSSPAYDACTACSETVLRAYAEEGDAFLTRAFQDPVYLERLTGLADLHASTAGMELQWMEDGDDDDDEEEAAKGASEEGSDGGGGDASAGPAAKAGSGAGDSAEVDA